MAQNKATQPPLAFSLPMGTAVCELAAIDTTCELTVPARTLVEPVIKGHELMNFPTVAFLITHGPSKRHLLFDLGCRKDFWNLPPPITQTIDTHVPGIKVQKSIDEVLVEGQFDLLNLEAAIISHHHYDHIGDPSILPKSVKLVVGPGFKKTFLPGYPTVQASPCFEEAFQDRVIDEITFSSNLKIGGFEAHDYFGDGSFYILNAPGHAIGHMSALVRTTEDTFVLLGGDVCHFGGSFRPSPQVPMPLEVVIQEGASPCSSSLFSACHPDPANYRTAPYYAPYSASDSWYCDPPLARESIHHVGNLDANENVLVLIAHDPSIMKTIPFFPNGVLNDWKAAGWKQATRWGFLNELPIDGKPKPYLVDGTYMNGKKIKDLDVTHI